MDTQSESCEPPPCDPQPPGKIRKALKLFSKRKPGSSMASIFSMRSKSEGGPKSPPSRSKTSDGLTESMAPEAEAESMDLDQEDSQKEDAPMEEPAAKEGNLETTPTRQSISSITSAKSLSFLNMLRRSRKGGGERYAQTESQRPGRQRKALKGLFGSVRWPGKDKEGVDEVEPGPPLLASRSNSVEIIKENLTLTPRPAPRSPDDSEIEQQPPSSQVQSVSSEDSTKVSETAKPPTNDRLSTLLGDISSILSFDTLTSGGDIVADVEAEWAKVSNRVEETDETGKKDKAFSAAVSAKLKPTLSPTSTQSSTSSSKPSPTTTAQPFSSSTTSPKPMPSPTTKSTFSPASSPSPSILAKPTPSPTSAPTLSPIAKPETSSLPTPVPSPVTLIKPILIPSPKLMQTPPTTPTLTISSKPVVLIPTPSPTFEPDTSSPAAAPEPAPISETFISPTVQSDPEPPGPYVSRTETTPIPTPPAVTKPPQTPAPAPTSKPSHSTAPAPKYPPFSTSTKPASTGPVTRPKYVTTFGLSTSRNTAPIAKTETKQPAPGTKSSPPLSQTDLSGLVSGTAKSPTSEFGPSYAVKPATKPQAAISKPIQEHATSAKPTHKPEPVSPPIQPTFSTGPRGEKTAAHTRPQQSQPAGQDQSHVAAYKAEKKSPAVKPATLSKIPVSGGGRPKQLHKDGQSNGDEGHWNLPTPVHEEESPITLSRESSSKEPLSDFSTGSGAVTPTLSHSHEDILDSRPIIGATSLSRESKIPMKPGSTATYHSLQGKTEAARSKIPVSKMPVRRTSNKPPSTATASATQK